MLASLATRAARFPSRRQNNKKCHRNLPPVRTLNDERWLSLADAFNAAALDSSGWPKALTRLAEATGSRAGQLLGTGAGGGFNWLIDPEPDWIDDIVAAGGLNPAINPRIDAGLKSPALQLITDRDIITNEERRRNPLYADYLDRYDRPFICATSLFNEPGNWVGLAVLRTRAQGEIDRKQSRVLASLAPHVRAAVRTQIALENQGGLILAGALETLSLTVFICDRAGRVREMTRSAEALLSAGAVLSLRHGQLRAADRAEADALAKAIHRAAAGLAASEAPASSTIVIRRAGEPPLVLDVSALPAQRFAFGFEPRVLVLVREARPNPARVLLLLQSAFRLTEAEAQVALQLAEGQAPEAIAATRGVSVGTVRSQLKMVYAKLGVHRQSELVAYLNHLH